MICGQWGANFCSYDGSAGDGLERRTLFPPVLDALAAFIFRVLKAVSNDAKEMAVLNHEHFFVGLVRQ